MAKKGSGNPADAQRKAQKARELKKNKEARKAAREGQTVKRDTRDIESQIKHLKGQKLDDAGKKRLEALESELKYVNKTKEAYVKAHPEAKDRVYKQHRPQGERPEGEEEQGSAPQDPYAHLYDEHGKLRDPKRSVYYDPLYNPYGVPPPGMPYKERTPEEESEEDSDEDDSDDEIVMPEGRPPGAESDSDEDSDDSDYVPLPPGPKPGSESVQPPPLPSLPSNVPRGPRNPHVPYQPPPSTSAWGWGDELANAPPQAIQATPMAHGPPRPGPARFNPPPNAGLPARPGAPPPNPSIISQPTTSNTPATTSKPPTSSKPVDYSAAAIEAAPQIRDLRKEATVFVPRGVKRKQASAPGGVTVNAAPGSGEVDEDGDERRVKRTEDGGGLLGKLKGAGVLAPRPAEKGTQGDDEYQKFLDGLGGLD